VKEVKLVFGKGGRVKILAEGMKGKGTENFTMKLAQELGRVVERHKGPHHVHVDEKTEVEVQQ
jgi:hypothetical protein